MIWVEQSCINSCMNQHVLICKSLHQRIYCDYFKVTAEEKKHLQANIHYIFTSLLSKGQNHLVPLEGSSNNTCWHPPPPIDCMKTFPFSLHLFKHVYLELNAEKNQTTFFLIKILYLEGFCHKSKTYLSLNVSVPPLIFQLKMWHKKHFSLEELRRKKCCRLKNRTKNSVTSLSSIMFARFWWLSYYYTRCDSEHCPKTQNADKSLVEDGPAVNKHGLVKASQPQTDAMRNLKNLYIEGPWRPAGCQSPEVTTLQPEWTKEEMWENKTINGQREIDVECWVTKCINLFFITPQKEDASFPLKGWSEKQVIKCTFQAQPVSVTSPHSCGVPPSPNAQITSCCYF